MVEHMKQARGQCQCRGQRHAIRLERQREAKPDIDNTDVLHRVVGEQALEIVLHQRIQHSHHRGDAADGTANPPPPPGVMPPTASTSIPPHKWAGPSRSNTMRLKPYTATFVITP